MIYNKIVKLKKYLFLISILFLVLTLSHLIYTFLYNDSKTVPIKWWTVSEWLIWSFPSLNPLRPLTGNNKYIVNLLYRSLLRYDSKENKIVSDLASCDIENLKQIECYLKDNIFWSNWEPITTEDIISTYNLLQNTWVNKITSSLLQWTTIEQNNNTIIFKNEKRDINFLNIFFQPILSKKTIDSIGNDTIFWDFPTHEQIYSWDFIISNISSDLTLGITKIFLTRNEFNNQWNISKLIIKLFPNTNSLLQNKEVVNVFNDSRKIIWDSIPRLESHKYTLPQYVALFININNVKNLELRNYIFNKINTSNLISLLGKENFKEVNNPYLTGKSIKKELNNKNFEKLLWSIGYIKKSKIISNYLPSTNTYSNEAPIKKETTTELEINDEDLNIDKFQVDSKYIVEPAYVDKYNFITKEDVLLQWNAWKNVDAVYINDYKLTNFKSNSSKFYYRLKLSYNTLKEWINSYKIIFEENWKKELKEEIFFVYSKDKNKLEDYKKQLIKELYIKEKEEKEKLLEATVKVEIDKNKLTKLSTLDEKYYYNENLEKYTLNLYYISTEKELEDTAFFIKNSLLEIWIDVELFPITLSNLSKVLADKSQYDMLLTWVNLWYFDYNIFPYFHSSQVKNWYNFSNIKKTSLDILLEDLKSETKNNSDVEKIKDKIIEILKKEQIVKTLYTPKINLLIDKNIKNIDLPNKLSNKVERKNIYNTIYIKEEKIIKFENKWFFNFIKFLINKLNA
jgi:hypothetical protein